MDLLGGQRGALQRIVSQRGQTEKMMGGGEPPACRGGKQQARKREAKCLSVETGLTTGEEIEGKREELRWRSRNERERSEEGERIRALAGGAVCKHRHVYFIVV